MMKGYIGAVLGTPIACEARIGRSLSRVAPAYQQRRRSDTARLLNPVPYTAAYYGHKLHIDQNEKLAMFGVTHVCAIDGYSKYIPAYCTMSVKNNLVIYENIYSSVHRSVLWPQVTYRSKRETGYVWGDPCLRY